jgi:hypothetical protein
MHIGIFLAESLFFDPFSPTRLFDFTPIRRVGGRWQAASGTTTACPLCCRPFVCSLALTSHPARFLDFRRLDLNDYNRRLGLNLASRDLEEEMSVIFRGQVYRGFYGYRRIALAVPAFWPLAPWLFLPGVSSLGVWVYGYVTRNRLKFHWYDSHCPVQPSEEGESAKVATTGDAARGFGYALVVSGIIVIALLCWFYRIEFYPFLVASLLGFRYFGESRVRKVFAQHESGVFRAGVSKIRSARSL